MIWRNLADNNYIPKIISVQRVIKETPDIKTFYLKYPLDFIPGQFMEVSCFGLGEVPISISSSPTDKFLELTFKRVGYVTAGLFNLKSKDSLGIRGPFGNGFSLEQLDGKDLIFIAGGIGVAPLRSFIKYLFSRRDNRIGNISLLYGARQRRDLLFKKELEHWAKSIKVLLTVDKADSEWKGRVGVVVQLLNEIRIEPSRTKAFICGPGVMMRFATAKLIELGMAAGDIILSLERHMECGEGKCGHCYIGDKFVCRDGPVFTYDELNNLIPIEILR